MVCGPRSSGGKAYRQLFAEQGLAKILLFISHVRQESELGKQLRILVESTQLRVGSAHPILTVTSTPLLYCSTDAPWLLCLRHFLRHINGTIALSDNYIPPKQRQGDVAIMDSFMEYTSSQATQERLNQVRLYLQVFWTSDIVDGSGMHLRRAFFDNPPCDITQPRTQLHWPRQGRPGQKAFNTWRHMLRKVFLTPGSRLLTLSPQYRLQKWIVCHQALPRRWDHVYQHRTHTLFQRIGTSWYSYPLIRRTATSCTYDPLLRHLSLTAPDERSYPATIDRSHTQFFRASFRGMATQAPSSITITPNTSFRSSLRDGSPCDTLLRHFNIVTPTAVPTFCHLLRSGGELWLVPDLSPLPI